MIYPKICNYMVFKINRTLNEIETVYDEAVDGLKKTNFPGKSYEDGIIAFADWLFGLTNDHPFA